MLGIIDLFVIKRTFRRFQPEKQAAPASAPALGAFYQAARMACNPDAVSCRLPFIEFWGHMPQGEGMRKTARGQFAMNTLYSVTATGLGLFLFDGRLWPLVVATTAYLWGHFIARAEDHDN